MALAPESTGVQGGGDLGDHLDAEKTASTKMVSQTIASLTAAPRCRGEGLGRGLRGSAAELAAWVRHIPATISSSKFGANCRPVISRTTLTMF